MLSGHLWTHVLSQLGAAQYFHAAQLVEEVVQLLPVHLLPLPQVHRVVKKDESIAGQVDYHLTTELIEYV